MITLHTLTKHPLLKGDTHFSIQIVTSCYLFMLPKIFFFIYIRKREIVCATIVSSLIVFTTLLYYAHSFFFYLSKRKRHFPLSVFFFLVVYSLVQAPYYNFLSLCLLLTYLLSYLCVVDTVR